MRKPSQYINDICSECNPRNYDKTLSKFAGEENIVEVVGEPDYSFAEYLYECCVCGEKNWVDEQWVKRNSVEVNEIDKEESGEMRYECPKCQSQLKSWCEYVLNQERTINRRTGNQNKSIKRSEPEPLDTFGLSCTNGNCDFTYYANGGNEKKFDFLEEILDKV